MKKIPTMLCKAIAYVIAAPFLAIGFVLWVVFGSDNPCVGCPNATDYCGSCRENPARKKKEEKTVRRSQYSDLGNTSHHSG